MISVTDKKSNISAVAVTVYDPTTTALTASPNPATTGQQVTFTASVQDQAKQPVAGGTVTFEEGTTALCGPATTDATGTATCRTGTLAVGTHTVTASLAAFQFYTASKSASINETISSWARKSGMPTPRYGLNSGVINNVLYAVGGQLSYCPGTYNEAYDPSVDMWSAKAPVIADGYGCGRMGAAAGAINNILYLAGGAAGSYSTQVEAYDPSANRWSIMAPLSDTHYFPGAGVVGGALYVVGGYNGSFPVGTVAAYDPSINSWTKKSPMPTSRWLLAAAVVNGILYAVGGMDENGKPLNTIEAYDPSRDAWTTRPPMPTARFGLAIGVVNGILYVVGGADGTRYLSTVEAYNPSSNSWTVQESMPTPREQLAVEVVRGTLYAVGGVNSSILNTVEAFTPP
ncbi:MAG: hypothetical protein NVSMB64_10760 [Candidatus Velthaea sp.]